MRIVETAIRKTVRSPGYNYNFSKVNGYFERWGEAFGDDPEFSPFGPEILDIELSTGDCSGGANANGESLCKWCYKSNSMGDGKHMSLGTFKVILDKVAANRTLTQLAAGITDADANPDFIPIMRYAREKGVIPNYTTSGYGLNKEIIEATASLCGAVAVSMYPHNRSLARLAIRNFLDVGMKQVNVHLLYYKENLNFCREIISTIGNLVGLNAVVLLALKPVGRAKGQFAPVSREEFGELVDCAFEHEVPIGFDSCSAPAFEEWARRSGRDDMKQMLMLSESCESTAFSAYVDVNGTFWPCSFLEGTGKGVSVLEAEDFLRDVWFAPGVVAFREKLLATRDEHGTRRCPVYDI